MDKLRKTWLIVDKIDCEKPTLDGEGWSQFHNKSVTDKDAVEMFVQTDYLADKEEKVNIWVWAEGDVKNARLYTVTSKLKWTFEEQEAFPSFAN